VLKMMEVLEVLKMLEVLQVKMMQPLDYLETPKPVLDWAILVFGVTSTVLQALQPQRVEVLVARIAS